MIDDKMISGVKIPPSKYEEIERRVVDLYVEQDIHNLPIDPFEIIKNRGYVLMPFSKFEPNNRPDCIDEDKGDILHVHIHKTPGVEFHDEATKERIYFGHPIYEKYKKFFKTSYEKSSEKGAKN